MNALPCLPLLFVLLLPTPARAADLTREPPEARDQRMAWFREARFGLFIHWGVYAVPAGEYKDQTGFGEWYLEESKMPVSEYEKFAAQFHPVKFNAADWVRMAKDAGMRYIVITSKHHDGFGLFRSAQTDWCIRRTPFAPDPLKELADACRKEGLRLCFYHSIMDWHHPDWPTRRAWNDQASGTPDMDRYVAYMKAQLKELLTGYGPIGILWFDGEWESPWTHERGVDLYHFVRTLQPDLIVNNRIGKGRGGMDGMDRGQGVGDYGTPEQEIPATGFPAGVDWESCMTMNNHWGYNKHDHHWKSTATLVRNLIDCASKGGNYLLNVGPTAEGTFPDASIQRLAEIGRWMKVNRESIYGTTASPFNKSPWGRTTQKPGQIYLHVYHWPADAHLDVPLKNRVEQARLLASPHTKSKLERNGDLLRLHLPPAAPDPLASVIALDLDGPPQTVLLLPTQGPDRSLLLLAEDATIVGQTARLEHKGGLPNIGYWTDAKDTVHWTAQVTSPGPVTVEADYALDSASQGSRIRLHCGSASLETVLAPTGAWDQFKTVALGTMVLEDGRQNVVITPLAKPGQGVMNLRALRFKPTVPR